jgi:Flp pilus assembly protein TadG
MMRLLRRRRGKAHRGQTLVEFALILPVFLLVLMGILDLGRAVYYSSTLNNAAREAARQAIVDQTCANVITTAEERAVGMDASVTAWWTSPEGVSKRTCSPEAGTAAIGDVARVTVEYDFNAATPVIGNIVGTIHLQGESTFTVEATCVDGNPPGTTCPAGS